MEKEQVQPAGKVPVKAPPPRAQAEWLLQQAELRVIDCERRLTQGRREQVLTPAMDARFERELRDAILEEKLCRHRLKASHVRYILPEPMYDDTGPRRSRSAPTRLLLNEKPTPQWRIHHV